MSPSPGSLFAFVDLTLQLLALGFLLVFSVSLSLSGRLLVRPGSFSWLVQKLLGRPWRVSYHNLLRSWLQLRLRGFRARGPQRVLSWKHFDCNSGIPTQMSPFSAFLARLPTTSACTWKRKALGSRLIIVVTLLAKYQLLIEDIIFGVHLLDVMVQSLHGPSGDGQYLNNSCYIQTTISQGWAWQRNQMCN